MASCSDGLYGGPCRRLSCPVCGPKWVRYWRQVLDAVMDAHGGDHVAFTVTAPGRWSREWEERRDELWKRLHAAAQQAVYRELGRRADILARVWEPQRRGAMHVHVVVGLRTDEDLAAATRYGQHLSRLSGEGGFGLVFGFGLPYRDKRKERRYGGSVNRQIYRGARSASRYLSAYFVGKGENGKAGLLSTVTLDYRPNRPVWVSPRYTARTGVTMRSLRLAGRLWAAHQGLASFPSLTRVRWEWDDSAGDRVPVEVARYSAAELAWAQSRANPWDMLQAIVARESRGP